MKSIALVLSCEHGGNEVPPPYHHLFINEQALLDSHRGYDIGALNIARALQSTFQCAFHYATITRLLVDCNRNEHHVGLFSELTRPLSKEQKQTIYQTHYLPYRTTAESLIKHHLAEDQQVLHLSIHSFTPILNEKKRNAAIGLLYDPLRHGEKEVCRIWQSLIQQQSPSYRTRLNYPYRGYSDSFTVALRKKYSEKEYLGIEVEMNQCLLMDEQEARVLQGVLIDSLRELLMVL